MEPADQTAHVHEVDEHDAALIASWCDAKAMARKASAEESELRDRVLEALRGPGGTLPGQELIGDRHTLHIYRDGRLLLVLRDIPSERVDAKALRSRYASIADQFTVLGHSVRMDAP